MELKAAGLARRDHQADLANACGGQRRCVGDLAPAEAGTEVGKRQVQGLPVGAREGKADLLTSSPPKRFALWMEILGEAQSRDGSCQRSLYKHSLSR